MQRGLRVIADHAARRRDFDAAHPGQPAQVFDDARTDVRRLALGVDVGVVVKKYRQTAVRRFDQTGDVALEEANYIAFGEVFDGQRRDHRRVRDQLNRNVQVVEDLRPRGTVHPDPGLYGSRIEDGGWRMEDRVGRSILDPRSSILDPRSSPLSVDAANFVDFDLHYALAFGVGDAVPFARGAHAEDHIGAVAFLDDVANDPPLLIGDHSAGVVQNRDDRDVQTWLECVAHFLFH